jgi:cytochrome c551
MSFLACEDYPQGQFLYQTYCANCHMDDGSGLARLIPPLAGADYLANYPEQVPCIIQNGAEGAVTVNGITYSEPMPSFNNLDEIDLSNLINYINTSWGNDYPVTNPRKIRTHLDSCSVR